MHYGFIQSPLWTRGCLISSDHREVMQKEFRLSIWGRKEQYLRTCFHVSVGKSSPTERWTPPHFQVTHNSSRSLPPSQGPKSSWIGTLSGPDVRCCQVALVWSDQCPWTVWNMRLGGSGVVHSCPTKPILCNTEICSCPSLCSSPYYVLRPSCFFVRISCSPSLKEERYKSDLPENPSRWRKAMVSAKI